MMCDFCTKVGEHGSFEARLLAVADTINRHDPDLISLQEIRTGGQVEELQAHLREKYVAVFASGFLINYPDPALLIRKSRFDVVSKNGFWLGPSSPGFTLGWKLSFPRRVEYVELKDRQTSVSFIFAGTHFDNNPRNREPSAEVVIQRFSDFALPFIFAGDTNLRPDRGGYVALANAFHDTFRGVEGLPYVANGPTLPTDGCNLEKAPVFPDCRVDHVFLSKVSPWISKNWRVDVYKYPGTKGFLSDHRAVVVDLAYE
jgi:hypothetical protein